MVLLGALAVVLGYAAVNVESAWAAAAACLGLFLLGCLVGIDVGEDKGRQEVLDVIDERIAEGEVGLRLEGDDP